MTTNGSTQYLDHLSVTVASHSQLYTINFECGTICFTAVSPQSATTDIEAEPRTEASNSYKVSPSNAMPASKKAATFTGDITSTGAKNLSTGSKDYLTSIKDTTIEASTSMNASSSTAAATNTEAEPSTKGSTSYAASSISEDTTVTKASTIIIDSTTSNTIPGTSKDSLTSIKDTTTGVSTSMNAAATTNSEAEPSTEGLTNYAEEATKEATISSKTTPGTSKDPLMISKESTSTETHSTLSGTLNLYGIYYFCQLHLCRSSSPCSTLNLKYLFHKYNRSVIEHIVVIVIIHTCRAYIDMCSRGVLVDTSDKQFNRKCK